GFPACVHSRLELFRFSQQILHLSHPSQVRVLHSDACSPRMRRRDFMLTDDNSLLSSSSDLLSLLPECSHLTSFDSIPSIPPPTVSLALEASNQQALQAKSRDVQLDAVTRYICNVGLGGTGKGDRRGHYPTPGGPVTRTKESPGTFNAASNMARKFQLDDCDCKDVFIRCETTDKKTINVNYTKGQEDHHPQSPTPGSGDTVREVEDLEKVMVRDSFEDVDEGWGMFLNDHSGGSRRATS
ncbi:hypothetical protein F5879DRAFT_1058208, partial [Lentinula edodes]